MKINRFVYQSVFQSLLLILLSLGMGYLLLSQLWFSAVFLFLLLLLTMAGICRYHLQQSEALKRLVAAIRFNDYSLTFNNKGTKGIDPSLANAMQEALTIFHQRACALEEEHLYYTTLLKTIDSGLVVLNQNQEIEWRNEASLRELQLPALQRLSDLQAVRSDLPQLLRNLKAGETRVIRLEQEGGVREIAFTTVLFRVKGKTLSLISLKNVHSILESNEIEAWQKLIRVLTHEIMNSLAPIISLSETLLEREVSTFTNEKNSSVTQQAIQAIHRRSKGLLEFVQNYRKLTRIPAPEPTLVPVKDLFADLQKLHSHPVLRYCFEISGPSLQVWADRTQLEQVLINLIRNAEEACKETANPEIIISAIQQADKIILSVQDNGPGIVPEAMDKIFVPFFTTKTGGSGIGLSLCKQIMTLHQGNITVSSQPEQGSCFQLIFPA